MAVRVAVVTGSNKGIGFSTVKFLCKQFEGDVILCSRDKDRGEAAVARLKAEGLQPKLAIVDISNRDTVEQLRDRLVTEYGGLDVLVNNAAIAFPHICDVPFLQQAQKTLQINYFDTATVCDILFPILRPHARVVNVSSSLGMLHVIPGEQLRNKLADPNLTRHDIDSLASAFVKDVETGAHLENGWPNSAYSTSKVLLSALSFAQHRQSLEDQRPDIVVNVVHPGYVDTDMTNHKGPLTPDEGCQSSVKGALVPPNGEPRGKFIWKDCTIVDWVNDKPAFG